MRRWTIPAALLAGCANSAPDCEPGTHVEVGVCVGDDTAGTTGDDTAETPVTAALLDAFYEAEGGRDAFPGHYVEMLEALLYAQDEVEAGEFEAARARVDAIFQAYPHSTDIWLQDATFAGLNVGVPIAYYGLRMLEPVVDAAVLPDTGTLTMTVVVAPCASVTRPTLPDLDPETVDLEIDPELLADDARVLRVSTDLFRAWVRTITGGLSVELVVYEMTECTTVDYTDDGATIVSYPDAAGMIQSVPADVSRDTDFWWVVAPSGVPGDGSGYDRHFITGGMGSYGSGLPLFLSDDGWFLRKPEHLGEGRYSEVERRAYQPQWFQHEFMHHLFRTWSELGLEESSHQWFDRSTWPDDFEGSWEPDYYAEAIAKRFGAVTPSLAEGLTAPEMADLSAVDLSIIAGNYERQPVENGYHRVAVVVNGSAATWTNAAGVSWSLVVSESALWTGADCPYGEQEVSVELAANGEVTILWFGGEAYTRVE